MPSCASISSNARLTSSSLIRCETNGATSISPASARATNWGTWSRPFTPPNDEPATRRPVIRKRGTTSGVSPLPATPGTGASPQPTRAGPARPPRAPHTGDGRQPPAHPRRLDRLTHDLHEARRLEGVVRAEAVGHL